MVTRGLKLNIERDTLIAHLYRNGAITEDIAKYLEISHGTVVNALKRKEIATRGRGRPPIDEPPPPTPIALMGASYAPPWMSGPEAESFVRRAGNLTFRADEIRARIKPEISPEFPKPDPIEQHAQISGLDDSSTLPPPSSPADVIAARLAALKEPGTNTPASPSPE